MAGARSNEDAAKSTRTIILDATESIMREEGYAAVSSRKIEVRAGLKSKLVHYHFETMDDLFLALFQRVEEQQFSRLTQSLASKDPLAALWKASIDTRTPRLHKEFIALATHRPSLRREIARSAERTRAILTAVLRRMAEERRIDEAAWPPAVMAVVMDATARLIVSERALGTEDGHAATIAWIERLIGGG